MNIGAFYRAGKEELGLRTVCGEAHFDRVIEEPVLNRPGLVFAGFFRHFALRRIQVCGWAEMAYLRSLTPEERAVRLRAFFGKRFPCLVLTRNMKGLPEMAPLGEEFETPIFRTHLRTGDFMQRGSVLIDFLTAPCTRVQGTTVDLNGIGVMIEGAPGVGKSEVAMSLIMRGYSLVSDDLTELRKTGPDTLIAAAVEITRYHMELRGLGIVHVPSLFGVSAVRREKRLDMIVTLQGTTPQADFDRTGLESVSRDILGVAIPTVMIPVAPGRDISHVVEVAALNFRLKQLGHDAAKELDVSMMKRLSGRAHPASASD